MQNPMKINLMTPEQIKQARHTLGLTGEQSARLLGYGGKARISEIEAGARNPSAAVLRLLQAYLDGYRPADWPETVKIHATLNHLGCINPRSKDYRR